MSVLSLALENGAYFSQKAVSLLRDEGLETCNPRAFCKPYKSHRIYDLFKQAKGAHTGVCFSCVFLALHICTEKWPQSIWTKQINFFAF